MAQHRMARSASRILPATGILLAGVVLSACGQPAGQTGALAETGGETQPRTQIENPPQGNDGGTSSSTATSTTTEQATTTEQDASPPPPERTPAQARGVERCHTSMLSGSVQRGDPGAGQRYAELVLTNDSAETCTLYGYGGLQLIDSNGAPLNTELTRAPSPGPAMIELNPGESAHKTLHWTAIPHQGEPTDGPCQPVPAGARVIPPDETDPLSINWAFGPVCGFGAIEGSAYYQ